MEKSLEEMMPWLKRELSGSSVLPLIASPAPMDFKARMMKAGAKGFFPLKLGTIQANIVGGPYRNKPSECYGVKMAAELPNDCVISVPTVDFSVPDTGRLIAGLYCGITLAQQQVPIYVGCFGGVGRTGLYFAALAKVMAKYQKLTKHKVNIDPILYTRQNYYSHAVETKEQMQWVNDLNVDAVAEWAVSISGYKPPWYQRLTNAIR